MATLIAACGLDCSQCESCQATQSNDLLALGAVVEKWSQEYHATGLSVDNIQCDGCMTAGRKVGHCSVWTGKIVRECLCRVDCS